MGEEKKNDPLNTAVSSRLMFLIFSKILHFFSTFKLFFLQFTCPFIFLCLLYPLSNIYSFPAPLWKHSYKPVMERLVMAWSSDWASGGKSGPSQGNSAACSAPDWKRWSGDPPLPRFNLMVGSGGKGILLSAPTYWRLSKGSSFFSFVSVPTAQQFCKSSLATV